MKYSFYGVDTLIRGNFVYYIRPGDSGINITINQVRNVYFLKLKMFWNFEGKSCSLSYISMWRESYFLDRYPIKLYLTGGEEKLLISDDNLCGM